MMKCNNGLCSFKWICLLSFLCVLLTNQGSLAATFYVDPAIGNMDNDGSVNHPWRTLAEVIDQNKIESMQPADYPYSFGDPLVVKNDGAPVQPGDTIVLMSGFHGTVTIIAYYNPETITIKAGQGQTPHLGPIEIRSSSKWVLEGLHISPSFATPYECKTLINLSSHNWTGPGHDLIVRDCTAFSVADASGWSEADWNEKACNGMSLSGDQMVAENNALINVNFGITVSGKDCTVRGNLVENFSGDGMRGLGDNGLFEYNTVKNCFDVNDNHDDGFQSWSNGAGGVGSGTVKGIVLRGNTIIDYEDPNQPYRGTLQGIGCFDGMFEDWVVENNVVIVDHWHGITLMGAIDCRIVNNTVVDLNTDRPGPPWIRISDHKNGTPSSGSLIRNNLLTTAISMDAGVTEDHNIILSDHAEYFVDYAKLDLHLKEDAPAIDAGIEDQAPNTDRDGNQRPFGNGWDVGAYEYHDGAPVRPQGVKLLNIK
jgi:hypothetical protein